MKEHDSSFGGDDPESFSTLLQMRETFERRGYFLYPVPKEHTEGAVTDPLVHRIRTHTKKRGFEKLAGRAILTFSGYAHDDREIFAIPEIRAFYRKLDTELMELPALVAYLPEVRFNGPGFHLMLLGTIDEAQGRPELGGYDVHVADAEPIVANALLRIQRAGATYRLRSATTKRLVEQFLAGATHRLDPLW
jgi:hypothetical protein